MIKYDRLWNTLKDRGISQYALINSYGISPAQLTRLRHNESVSTNTIEMFCIILDCRVEQIMEYIPDDDLSVLPDKAQKICRERDKHRNEHLAETKLLDALPKLMIEWLRPMPLLPLKLSPKKASQNK